MSSRREVLIRILAPLQRKTFISNKKSHIEMLKMALFDCAVNEKRLPCWRRTSGDSTAQEPPVPGICHLRQVELTDALWRKENEKKKRVVFFFTTFQSNGLHPKGLAHSFPAENIEMTSINAVYTNINYKLSLSVCLPFLRTSFGEISEIRRRVCLKFYPPPPKCINL